MGLPIIKHNRTHQFASGLLQRYGMHVEKHATRNEYYVMRGEYLIVIYNTLPTLFAFVRGVYATHREYISDILE